MNVVDQPGYQPSPEEEQLSGAYEKHEVFFRTTEAPGTAAELAAATCEKADPASLSTLAHPHRLSLQKRMARPSARGLPRSASDQSASTHPASKGLLPAMMEIRAFRSS
jgi:hypothetical protein